VRPSWPRRARQCRRGLRAALPTVVRARLALVIAVAAALAFAACGTAPVRHAVPSGPPPELGRTVFTGSFAATGLGGLVTNEYATWNRASAGAVRDDDWIVTSGSLFSRDGFGWSGVPDGTSPGPRSVGSNGSAVFRMTTRPSGFGDVAVRLRFRNLGLTSTTRTPKQAWDGIHVFLRYASPAELYYASLNRRDGTVAVKKKVHGGAHEVDGGTYTTLATGHFAVPYGAWQEAEAVVRDVGHDVAISVYVDGRLVVAALDHGQGGRAPITEPGRVGIRADNCNFEVASFEVAKV
jgi:hypothetical protein